MEKTIDAILKDFENKIHLTQVAIKELQEQADKRVDARIREAEIEARILEARTKWRPKDWFILTGMIGSVIAFLALLVVGLVLAFSYVPRTTTTTTTTAVEDVVHKIDTAATDMAENKTEANFNVQ